MNADTNECRYRLGLSSTRVPNCKHSKLSPQRNDDQSYSWYRMPKNVYIGCGVVPGMHEHNWTAAKHHQLAKECVGSGVGEMGVG